jgi:hypothetical protein
MKRRVYPVCIRSTDERCGGEHDNSCDECCHEEYAKISLRTLAIVTPPCGFPYSRRHFKATPAP